MRVPLHQPVLAGNQALADQNRARLRSHGLFCLNLISSPGAGKTTFLERWLPLVRRHLRAGVVEGDIATTLDAERIAACGVQAVQINTAGACHLDAQMVAGALDHLELGALDLLIIENVGNLVCPVEFDLGEHLRITLLSTPEGADKPDKYPAAFRRADAVILTKTDLLPHVPFDFDAFRASLQRLHAQAPIFPVAAPRGEGLERWTEWVLARRPSSSAAGCR